VLGASVVVLGVGEVVLGAPGTLEASLWGFPSVVFHDQLFFGGEFELPDLINVYSLLLKIAIYI